MSEKSTNKKLRPTVITDYEKAIISTAGKLLASVANNVSDEVDEDSLLTDVVSTSRSLVDKVIEVVREEE